MERDLTDEIKEIIINCGALGYDQEKIKQLTGLSEKDLKDKKCVDLYQKGVTMSEYLIDLKLFEMAKQGDLKALSKYERRKNINNASTKRK